MCGLWGEPQPERGTFAWVMGGGTIDELANALRMRLSGARVDDKTDVTDRFNAVLEFVPDDQASLVSALERQLGLRLESARAVREYLVIDAIERPSAN